MHNCALACITGMTQQTVSMSMTEYNQGLRAFFQQNETSGRARLRDGEWSTMTGWGLRRKIKCCFYCRDIGKCGTMKSLRNNVAWLSGLHMWENDFKFNSGFNKKQVTRRWFGRNMISFLVSVNTQCDVVDQLKMNESIREHYIYLHTSISWSIMIPKFPKCYWRPR